MGRRRDGGECDRGGGVGVGLGRVKGIQKALRQYTRVML